MERVKAVLRGLGPAMPRPTLTEALRAAVGAGVGLFVTGCLMWVIAPSGDLLAHPLLIAPFAASAVLIFGVPNAPLAQPWAVVVGNGVAALCGLAVLRLGLPALPAGAIAVVLAMAFGAGLRALHPPGGATALAVVLAAHPDQLTPWGFALFPVLTGSALLVATGILWNRSTGRVYPFRTRPAAPHGTSDLPPERRQVPSDLALQAALERLRLGANLGVQDLARLIASAEAESIPSAMAQISAEGLMSRDLVQVSPDANLPDLAQAFRSHAFKSLPIRNPDGSYGGIVPIAALVGLTDPALRAADLIDAAIRPAAPEARVDDLIALLSDGRQQIVPIVQGGRLQGLVTRSDMIALLVHGLSHR